jgi:ribosomal-protein-alanine N-acetyltransferase
VPVTYHIQSATAKQIQNHLQECSSGFIPVLETKLDIEKYAEKIFSKAVSFEAWEDHALIGLVAAYLNDTGSKTGFITNVSVLPGKTGRGVAKRLLENACSFAVAGHFKNIQLEVHRENENAIRLYHKAGFTTINEKNDQLVLNKILESK